MPKSLVLGNGNLLIGLDKYAQVRDFYYPFVGLENHVGAPYVHKIGVWVEGEFSWIDDNTWQIEINYSEQALLGEVHAFNPKLKIKIDFKDVVYNETNIFIRELVVHNLEDRDREIRIFFHQEFEIYESHRGDTCYFDPKNHVIVHYKGRRIFLINGMCGNSSFNDFSCGLFNIEGKEGTYKDSEDGILEKNGIEHGLVDSVISFHSKISANSFTKIFYWITAAKLLKDAHNLNEYVLNKTPLHLIKTTQDFWRAWVNKSPLKFYDLDESIVRLFKKSLLIIRSHVDNRGAIIASCDSDMLYHGRDTYSYMWPRDGALTALALDLAGDSNVARRFFEFCHHVISDEGYFMHKYRADESLGSSWHSWVSEGKAVLPIQEDETALIIYALWQHFQFSKDLEFIESVYNPLIKKAAEFMCNFRDEETKLPKPSYDLWEEKFGIHTFSAASVYGALIAAAKFANLLGKTDQQEHFYQVAREVKGAILKYLYDENTKTFVKMVNIKGGKIEKDHIVDCSSAFGIFKFAVLETDDDRLNQAFEITKDKLWVESVEGLIRYEGDQYYKKNNESSSNPWFITTLWYAQYKIAQAGNEEELKVAKEILGWVVKNALASGVLSEQLDPYSREQISAAPLTWSHSEFVVTVIQYLNKVQELGLKS